MYSRKAKSPVGFAKAYRAFPSAFRVPTLHVLYGFVVSSNNRNGRDQSKDSGD